MQKAIHFKSGGGPPESLQLQEIPIPRPESNDLLVKIKGCACNPVDTKIRQGKFPASEITGYDAAGIVEQVGDSVKGFKKGDEVIYSGVLGRQGSTAEYGLIDARLAGPKPKSWDWADSASLPLVGLTAWELLVDHFGIDSTGVRNKEDTILIINGAGGVGSIATQLCSRVFGLKNVIVTASRDDTVKHAQKMGATHVVDHHSPLLPQLQKHNISSCQFVMICHSTPKYIKESCELASTWGKIGSIVECEEPLQFQSMSAFTKALSFHWEFMFARGADPDGKLQQLQGVILRKLSQLADESKIQSTVTEKLPLTVANLRKAHEILESGKAIGKIAFTLENGITE